MKPVVFTVQEKGAILASRLKEQRALASKVAKMQLPDDAEAPRGCGLCNLFRRSRPVRTSESAGAAAGTTVGASARVAGSALFGVAKKAAAPNAKLAEAVSAMEARVQLLEGRVQACKADAARLHAAGNKAQALRALKKSKASEKTLATTQAALDAVQQQQDILEQAQVQQQLASALGSTSKKLKADKKMLSKAESAVDEASEARDLAADLESVVTEFAQNGSAFDDEDELLAELDELIIGSPPPKSAEEVEGEALRETQLKQEMWDEAERTRQALPSAPSEKAAGKRRVNGHGEKAVLLSAA